MSKKKKIRLLKSPSGKYGLAYHIGDVIEIDELRGESMIKDGTATEDLRTEEEKKAEEAKKPSTTKSKAAK